MISKGITTRGSAERRAFNAVLFVEYGFRPQLRELIMGLDKFGLLGTLIKAELLSREKKCLAEIIEREKPKTITFTT